MSNAASIRGPRRVRAVRPADPPPAPSVRPPPLPPPLPRHTPAAFAPTLIAPPTPRPARAPHAPSVPPARPPAPAPQMSSQMAIALGTTVKIDRPANVTTPVQRALRPVRGFIVGATLGAMIMVVFTASGSDRVRDTRAWLATTLRAMKKHATPNETFTAPPMVIPAAVIPVVDTPPPAAAPACAPGVSSVEPKVPSASLADTIPTLDVSQLPKAKPIHVWKPTKKPAQRAEAPSADDGIDQPAGDEASLAPSMRSGNDTAFVRAVYRPETRKHLRSAAR